METCIVPVIVGLIIGIGLGAMGYRYMLKRDPETLERWAKDAKAAGEAIESKVDEL